MGLFISIGQIRRVLRKLKVKPVHTGLYLVRKRTHPDGVSFSLSKLFKRCSESIKAVWSYKLLIDLIFISFHTYGLRYVSAQKTLFTATF